MHIIPGLFKDQSIYQKILKLLFFIVNSIILLPNFIDTEYFKYINQRSSFALFKLLGCSDDIFTLLPQFIVDFWYIIFAWLLFVVILWFLYPKLKVICQPTKKIHYVYQVLISFLILGVFFLFTRGLKLKPLGVMKAIEYTNAHNIPLVLNTPFIMLNYFNHTHIEPKKYYDNDKLYTIYSPVNQFKNVSSFKSTNVVIFILESFSKEYVDLLNNNKGFTPFLDSLMQHSLVFDNGFANGKQSIEAVPTILAGLPALTDIPYISSQYSANKINSLAGILNKKGYHTAFFHGGSNGTMGFDNFAVVAGFDEYYGRNEYNNENDFDGSWGIYDEEFLQYFADNIQRFQQPFFCCLFTLSSHQPYAVPEKYKGKFSQGDINILESISYTDYSLKKFFQTASSMPWYSNTLFVITADHTAEAISSYYKNKVGIYAIPFIYFHPADSNLTGISHTITQQTDIMPSVLDYLNYDKKFVAFGNSVFDNTSKHFAVNYINGVFQIIENNYSLSFAGDKSIELYNLRTDSLLKNNILHSSPEIALKLENQLKAIIQCYYNGLISNQLTIE